MRKAVALVLLIVVATVGLTTAAAADIRVRGGHARVHRVAPPPYTDDGYFSDYVTGPTGSTPVMQVPGSTKRHHPKDDGRLPVAQSLRRAAALAGGQRRETGKSTVIRMCRLSSAVQSECVVEEFRTAKMQRLNEHERFHVDEAVRRHQRVPSRPSSTTRTSSSSCATPPPSRAILGPVFGEMKRHALGRDTGIDQALATC